MDAGSYKNITLIDDHVVVRSGIRELIEKLGPYKVTAEFDDGESFIESLNLNPEPDLVILDLSLPGMNGDEVMQAMNTRNITFPVLVLTLNREEETITKLFRMGVRGYLPKDCTAATLRSALEEIFRTGYFHNELMAMSLRQPADGNKNQQQAVLERLTEREKEFLYFVCDGNEYTYDQIGEKMGVARRTVDGYRESIFMKFGIKSKTGLVLFVLKHRLYDLLRADYN